MTRSRPLSFDRVRVVLDAESGLLRPVEPRRGPPAPRGLAALPWRMAAAVPARPAPAAAVKPAAAPQPPAGPLVPAAPSADPAPAPTLPAPARVDAVGPRTRNAAQPTPQPDSDIPVAAITRAIQDAAAVREIVTLIADTCNGEGRRETGPWSFSLPLAEQGFADASIELALSRESLLLRFVCVAARTRELLWRHADSLKGQLQEQLRPPLEVEILVETL
jgi:hypothetical protein